MSVVISIIAFVLVSPFMAISLLPALQDKTEEDDEKIVQWHK